MSDKKIANILYHIGWMLIHAFKHHLTQRANLAYQDEVKRKEYYMKHLSKFYNYMADFEEHIKNGTAIRSLRTMDIFTIYALILSNEFAKVISSDTKHNAELIGMLNVICMQKIDEINSKAGQFGSVKNISVKDAKQIKAFKLICAMCITKKEALKKGITDPIGHENRVIKSIDGIRRAVYDYDESRHLSENIDLTSYRHTVEPSQLPF